MKRKLLFEAIAILMLAAMASCSGSSVSDLSTKDHGHDNDRANPVIIEPVGDKEFECLPIGLDFSEGGPEPLNAGYDRISALTIHPARGRLPHVSE